MLHSGEKIAIRKGEISLEHKIISFVNVTIDQNWYDFEVGANYRICESYIAECVNIKRKKCIGVVRRYIYIGKDDKVEAIRMVSLIPYCV